MTPDAPEQPMGQVPLPIRERPRTLVARILGLLGGLLFWVLAALGLVGGAELSLGLALFGTFCGAVVIMVSLAVFGVKAYSGGESLRRFNLSSLLLLTLPLAIYLTYGRLFVSRIPLEEISVWGRVMLIVLLVFAAGVATLVFANCAEALVWIGTVWLKRKRKRAKESASDSSTR